MYQAVSQPNSQASNRPIRTENGSSDPWSDVRSDYGPSPTGRKTGCENLGGDNSMTL